MLCVWVSANVIVCTTCSLCVVCACVSALCMCSPRVLHVCSARVFCTCVLHVCSARMLHVCSSCVARLFLVCCTFVPRVLHAASFTRSPTCLNATLTRQHVVDIYSRITAVPPYLALECWLASLCFSIALKNCKQIFCNSIFLGEIRIQLILV